MSSKILEIISSKYPGSSRADVVAKVIADQQSDLPSRTAFSGLTLTAGSTAHVVADSTDWMINSSGTWVQQLNPLITNVYTKAEIDSMLTAYATITAMQTADQALQADINTRLTADQAFMGTELTTSADLNDFKTSGRFYSPRGGVTTSLHHRPVGIGNYGMTLEVLPIGSNVVQKITTGGGTAGHIYTRVYYVTSQVWQSWYDFVGTAVGTED